MAQQLVGRRLVLLLIALTLMVHEAEPRLQDLLVHATQEAHRMRVWLIETVIGVDERRDFELVNLLNPILQLRSLQNGAVDVSNIVLVHRVLLLRACIRRAPVHNSCVVLCTNDWIVLRMEHLRRNWLLKLAVRLLDLEGDLLADLYFVVIDS